MQVSMDGLISKRVFTSWRAGLVWRLADEQPRAPHRATSDGSIFKYIAVPLVQTGAAAYTFFNSPSGSGIPLRRWVMSIPVIGGMPWFLDNLACVGRGDNHAPPAAQAAGNWQQLGVWGNKCG